MKKEKNVLMKMRDIDKVFRCNIRKNAEENGLLETYRLIIFFLAHNDGLTQLELVKLTKLKAPTISLTLHKMEQEGYVIRKPAEDDARKVHVYLTDKGHEYDEKMKSIIHNLEDKVLGALSNEEIKELDVILDKLINVMGKEFGE